MLTLRVPRFRDLRLSAEKRAASLGPSLVGHAVAAVMWTDDDITDEPAGIRRVEMAAESKARRAAEQAERERQNAEMRERLKNVR
jgi:hypothetical protein